jgi:hypothetical protein
VRALAALALLVLGAAVGLAALAVYAWWWGLALTVAASLATVWALPRRWYALPPFALGWWAPVLVGWAGRREGDYALAGTASGYTLIGLGTVVVVSAAFLTTLSWPRREPAPAPDSAARDAR